MKEKREKGWGFLRLQMLTENISDVSVSRIYFASVILKTIQISELDFESFWSARI